VDSQTLLDASSTLRRKLEGKQPLINEKRRLVSSTELAWSSSSMDPCTLHPPYAGLHVPDFAIVIGLRGTKVRRAAIPVSMHVTIRPVCHSGTWHGNEGPQTNRTTESRASQPRYQRLRRRSTYPSTCIGGILYSQFIRVILLDRLVFVGPRARRHGRSGMSFSSSSALAPVFGRKLTNSDPQPVPPKRLEQIAKDVCQDAHGRHRCRHHHAWRPMLILWIGMQQSARECTVLRARQD
jgi:hypothetical protein